MSEYANHEVIDRIKALLPGFAERAQETEELRKVHPQNIAELDEAGFFKLCQPSQWGGYEADMETFYTAAMLVATACPSTGWCASILGIHNWHLALFPQKAQKEVWGRGPDRAYLVVVRPDGCGQEDRRRAGSQRQVVLVLGL